jgi:hypothetical protein
LFASIILVRKYLIFSFLVLIMLALIIFIILFRFGREELSFQASSRSRKDSSCFQNDTGRCTGE